MYIYVHICTHMYIFVHICTCMYMYLHVCTCMHHHLKRIVDATRTTAAHHIVRVRCGGTAMADIVLHASAGKRVQRMLAMSRGGIRSLTAVFVVSWSVRARLGVFGRRFDGCRAGSWGSCWWF